MIQFINEKIIETIFVPKGEKNNAISNAVILSTKIKNLTFYSESNSIDCYPSFGTFKIRIQKSPFKISYINNGVEILSEKDGYVKQKHIPLESVRENIKVDSIEMLRFNISTDEVLYGASGWGLSPWGLSPWGGVQRPKPIRVSVPRNKTRATTISIRFAMRIGYGVFSVSGLSIQFNFISERLQNG